MIPESATEKLGLLTKVLATQFLPKVAEQAEDADVGAKIFPGEEAFT